jgi:hypothetical protein
VIIPNLEIISFEARFFYKIIEIEKKLKEKMKVDFEVKQKT